MMKISINKPLMVAVKVCVLVSLAIPVHAEIKDAGEVDKVEMSNIWRQVINGDAGLVIKARLIGEMASNIRAKTGSPGPYRAMVSRVIKYSEPGCARIRIVYFFPAAKTVDGGSRDANIKFEQNFCLDGHIPRETVDLQRLPIVKGVQ